RIIGTFVRAVSAVSASLSHTTAVRRLIPPILIVVLWQFLVQRFGIGDGFIPAPTEVVTALHEWIFGDGGRYSGTWLASLRDSAVRVAAGFAVALLIGAPLGIAIGRSKLDRKSTRLNSSHVKISYA